jgi:hypothetical protein
MGWLRIIVVKDNKYSRAWYNSLSANDAVRAYLENNSIVWFSLLKAQI